MGYDRLYREHIRSRPWTPLLVSDLRGKDLACWCAAGLPCHADVLIEMANT
jgi:hypothetical protein